jgi:hypothetical protein
MGSMTHSKSVLIFGFLGILIFISALILPLSFAEGSNLSNSREARVVELDTDFVLKSVFKDEIIPKNWKLLGAYRVARNQITEQTEDWQITWEWVPHFWCDLDEAYSREAYMRCQSTARLPLSILIGEKPIVIRVFQSPRYPKIKSFKNWDLNNADKDHSIGKFDDGDGESGLREEGNSFLIEGEWLGPTVQDQFPHDYPCGHKPLLVYRDHMKVREVKGRFFKRVANRLFNRGDKSPRYEVSFDIVCDPQEKTLKLRST